MGITTPAVTITAVARPSSSPPTRSVRRAGRIVASRPAQIAVKPSQYAERLSSWPHGRGTVGRPVGRARGSSAGTTSRSSSLTASTEGTSYAAEPQGNGVHAVAPATTLRPTHTGLVVQVAVQTPGIP